MAMLTVGRRQAKVTKKCCQNHTFKINSENYLVQLGYGNYILGYGHQHQGSLVDNQEDLDPPEMRKDKN